MADDDPTTLRPLADEAESSNLKPYFEVVVGTRQGERLPLMEGTQTIGKGDVADIRLEASGVSRLHARADVDGLGVVTVTDLESTNGTFVGKQRVQQCVLSRGDRVHLGPDVALRLVFLRAGAAVRATVLSPRQLELARLVATGMTNAQIAAQLGIQPRTVTSHLDHIYTRLDIRSRSALTRWVVERGLVG